MLSCRLWFCYVSYVSCAECRYSECHCAECRGTLTPYVAGIVQVEETSIWPNVVAPIFSPFQQKFQPPPFPRIRQILKMAEKKHFLTKISILSLKILKPNSHHEKIA